MLNKKFTTRILFFVFLIIPIPLIFNLFFIINTSCNQAKSKLLKTINSSLNHYNFELEKNINQHQILLKKIAKTLSLKILLTTEDFFIKANQELLALSDTPTTFYLMNPLTGAVYNKDSGDILAKYLKENSSFTIQNTPSKNTCITISDKHYLFLSDYIHFFDNTLPGIIVSACPITSLFQNINPLSSSALVFLLHKNNIIASSQKDLEDCTFYSEKSASQPNQINIIPTFHKLKKLNLVCIKINDKTYIGKYSKKTPLQDISILTFIPMKGFLFSIFKTPINIILFYIITICLTILIISKTQRKLGKPLQELTTCMQLASKGSSLIRFDSQPYGFEINDLGDIFNQTLISLLNYKDKAEWELRTSENLQKELALIESLDHLILSSPPKLPSITHQTHYLQKPLKQGFFSGWQSTPNNHLLGVIGYTTGLGLPSYLYSLSVRSLFLSLSSLYPNIEDIVSKLNHYISKLTTHDLKVSLLLVDLNIENKKLLSYNFGLQPPTLFLKKGSSFSQISTNEIILSPNDSLFFINSNVDTTKILNHLSIEKLLMDNLNPLSSEDLIEFIAHNLKHYQDLSIEGFITKLNLL